MAKDLAEQSAKIRIFPVDPFPIKAYYWIVRMGKAKLESDSEVRKEPKAEN